MLGSFTTRRNRPAFWPALFHCRGRVTNRLGSCVVIPDIVPMLLEFHELFAARGISFQWRVYASLLYRMNPVTELSDSSPWHILKIRHRWLPSFKRLLSLEIPRTAEQFRCLYFASTLRIPDNSGHKHDFRFVVQFRFSKLSYSDTRLSSYRYFQKGL